MANFNIERIRFRWTGDWQVSNTYVKDDVVRYQGKTYVCLVGHESNANNIYPDLNYVAGDGKPAPKWELMFDGYQWRGDWTPNTYYNLGDIVKWKGYIYQTTVPHESNLQINQGPIPEIGNWTIVATTYNWLNTWTASVAPDPQVPGDTGSSSYYDLGDVVTYNGITYICTEKHVATDDISLGLEDDGDKWSIVTRSDNWRTDWQPETRYMLDDVVKYGAIVYRCTQAHTSADAENGLENDDGKWVIVIEGIEYKGNWQETFRYKKNDIVKSGGALWKANQGHNSTTSLRLDEGAWDIWIPGLEYEPLWDASVEYNKGDIVSYGGYTYTALTNNTNSIPSVNGLAQDTGDWELLKQGYRFREDWDISIEYRTGDVIRNEGHLYIAIADSTGTYPDSDTNTWQVLVDGRNFRDIWADNREYFLGDMVTYAGTLYICIQRHLGTESDTRPDLDIQNTNENYWRVLVQGTVGNVMTNIGDIRTHDGTEHVRLAVGTPGNALKVNNSSAILWENFEEVPQVVYVSVDGFDAPGNGLTLSSPFRTIKYACEYIASTYNNDSVNTTIFIKTGIYDELLPIKVPRNCALVGDELRGTVVQPAPGYEESNMFYVNNGSGIRNMTLQGLYGTLGEPNQYLTRRPSAGAFVSLDPGAGPDDDSVWITTKSCYVQNVTTFGTACVGMKIDGSLHNGGNRSVVANDFTQVISDGIGYWATDGGRSELVSVFTYYCHIGYLAEHGGILRATNGNNSYGTYGSVAEGFDQNETPISAEVNNQSQQASINVVHTNGTNLLAVGYDNMGQHYTSVNPTINGTGAGADINYEEFRERAISNIRILGPGDSSIPGGLNYQYLLNNAQEGNSTSIVLAAADDTGTAEKYVGMRIVLVAGKGVGQYGYITAYNSLTKRATISKEYNGSAGWEHLYPGYPIENVLDNTTRYSLEPRVIVEDPGFNVSTNNSKQWPSGFLSSGSIVGIANLSGTWVVTTSDGKAATSTDGSVFTLSQSDLTGSGNSVGEKNSNISNSIMFLSSSNSSVYRYNVVGDSWSTISLSSFDNLWTDIASDKSNNYSVAVYAQGWNYFSSDGLSLSSGTFTNVAGTDYVSVAYGNGKFVAINDTGTSAVTTDGTTWTETVNAVGDEANWHDITYGNGRFVAVGETISNVPQIAYSFDGVTWYESDGEVRELTNTALRRVVYSNGEFLAITDLGSNDLIIKSKDGWAWSYYSNEDSTAYALGNGSAWNTVGTNGAEFWLSFDNQSPAIFEIETGTPAWGRAVVESSRVTKVIMYDPGSNYQVEPQVTFVDPEATIDAAYTAFVRPSGVLPQPVFVDRGTGYVTSTIDIDGDGYADDYQTGRTLFLKNVTGIPGPGANVVINGIDDVTYRLTKVVSQSGVGPYNLEVTISPSIDDNESPDHEESIIIREQYSQIRLTGHDFLDIGTGNINSTRYPQLYLEGEDAENARQPFNETVNNGGGRVFYTSTDQDGNFRVGELFEVRQATGSVSVNADLFELDGLEELSLGGIQVGGSAVVIREFSKDGTFVANSNNIVPTQAAIIKYLESRISSGGSDALTNTLIAGQVKVSGHNITTTSGLQINIPVLANQTQGGIDGDYLALQLFGI
jgi:hypothetical protein